MATKLCENCQRQIAAENYEVHTLYCKRNLQICPLCQEPVLKREQREHFEEFHEEIECIQCGKKLTMNDEASHLANECGKRQAPCKYCEIMLPRERLVDHEGYCGSRTDLCEKCCKYVLIKDHRNHVNICDGENPYLLCKFCGTLTASNRLATHQQECFSAHRRVEIPLFVEDNDGILREFAAPSGSETATELEDGTTGNQGDVESISQETADPQEEGRSSLSETNSVVALPCEVCGELCAADKLMEHQIECNQQTERAGESCFRGRGSNQRGVERSGQGFEEFQFPHDMDTLFEDSFFNRLHERMLPCEIIRRSLFLRM